MSRKEQPGTSKPSPMASLSRIVSRLDQARLTGEKLEEALGHLGIAVGAGAVAIYRKWYDDLEYRKEGDVVHSLIFTPAVTGGGVFLTGSTKKMHDVNGYAYGSLHIVQDITRERQIESKLHSSESMFQTIADYAGLGIALFQKEKALFIMEETP